VEELAPLAPPTHTEADAEGAAAESERSYAAMENGARGSALQGFRAVAAHPDRLQRSCASATGRAATEGLGLGCGPRVDVERIERSDTRAVWRTTRLGALVHALLASIDLKADPPAVEAAASVYGRIVGANRG